MTVTERQILSATRQQVRDSRLFQHDCTDASCPIIGEAKAEAKGYKAKSEMVDKTIWVWRLIVWHHGKS